MGNSRYIIAHPGHYLEFYMEKHRPMEMRPEQSTRLVYYAASDKYRRDSGDYIHLVLPKQKEWIQIGAKRLFYPRPFYP